MQEQEQLKAMKEHLKEQVEHHQKEIEHHEEAIRRHREAMKKHKKGIDELDEDSDWDRSSCVLPWVEWSTSVLLSLHRCNAMYAKAQFTNTVDAYQCCFKIWLECEIKITVSSFIVPQVLWVVIDHHWYICHLPALVCTYWEKTVWPWAVLKTKGTVFPNADQPRLANNLFQKIQFEMVGVRNSQQ